MITDQDVEKLKKTFITKEDLKEEIGDLRIMIGEISDRIDVLDGKFDSLDVKFDAMLGLLTDSMQEHGVGAAQYARHDRQIRTLAAATGTELPD